MLISLRKPKMNINIRYGTFGCCEVSCDQQSVFLSDEVEKVELGLELLDYAIELISNTTSNDNDLPQELLAVARRRLNETL